MKRSRLCCIGSRFDLLQKSSRNRFPFTHTQAILYKICTVCRCSFCTCYERATLLYLYRSKTALMQWKPNWFAQFSQRIKKRRHAYLHHHFAPGCDLLQYQPRPELEALCHYIKNSSHDLQFVQECLDRWRGKLWNAVLPNSPKKHTSEALLKHIDTDGSNPQNCCVIHYFWTLSY